MKKDAFWFRHDSNAKDDPKCVLLIDQLGLEGYGIYWVLVELLREQPDYTYPLAMVPSIARRYGTTAEKMLTVIKNFELFEINDDKFFWSQSLVERMMQYNTLRKKRIEAGKTGGNARWAIATSKQPDSNLIATSKQPHSDNIRKDSNRVDNIDNSSSIDIDSELFVETEPVSTSDSLVTPDEFKDMWNDGRGNCPKVAAMTAKRKAKALTRLKEFGKTGREQREVIDRLLQKIRESDFLQNEWKCNFDWLIDSPGNWVKVIEGNYANTKGRVATKLNINDKWQS